MLQENKNVIDGVATEEMYMKSLKFTPVVPPVVMKIISSTSLPASGVSSMISTHEFVFLNFFMTLHCLLNGEGGAYPLTMA